MPKEIYEMKDVTSLKDLLVEGEEVQLDLTEDAWEYGPPPPRGVYDMKLFFARDAWKQGQLSPNPNDIWLQANLECKIVSGDWEGSSVYGRVDTRVWNNRAISTMAGLVVKLGYVGALEKVNGRVTPKKLAQIFEVLMKKEPVLKVEIDWRGSYKYAHPKTGEDVWKNSHNSYSEFPDNGKGGRKHVTQVNSIAGGQVEVRAQVQITGYYAKGEELPKFDARGVKLEKKKIDVPKVKGAVEVEEPVVLDEMPEPEAKLVSAPKEKKEVKEVPKAKAAVAAVSAEDSDLEALLAE